jgi:hypothetical protein
MSDDENEYFNHPMFKQIPYFDFYDAVANYGFDFHAFKKDGFSGFVNNTFITDFIEFRRAYIKRDYHEKVRKLAHKFKGSFSVMSASLIYEKTNNLKMTILTGIIDVDDLYSEVVNAMLNFLDRLVTVSKHIGMNSIFTHLDCPINPTLLDKFYMLNDECNSYENKTVKRRLLISRDDGDSNVETQDGKIKIEKYESRGQCCRDGCVII